MNERIQELMVKSGLLINVSNFRVSELDPKIEKFAQLIVKECINEIHVADVGDLKGKGYYLDKVAEHIEKHFGVE